VTCAQPYRLGPLRVFGPFPFRFFGFRRSLTGRITWVPSFRRSKTSRKDLRPSMARSLDTMVILCKPLAKGRSCLSAEFRNVQELDSICRFSFREIPDHTFHGWREHSVECTAAEILLIGDVIDNRKTEVPGLLRGSIRSALRSVPSFLSFHLLPSTLDGGTRRLTLVAPGLRRGASRCHVLHSWCAKSSEFLRFLLDRWVS
jgi:hypothetical protein